MTERITKAFVAKRLETTTKNLRVAGVLSANESILFESTGSDKFPYRLYVLAIDENGSRHQVGSLTSNVTWQGLVAAVDATYETSWLATR